MIQRVQKRKSMLAAAVILAGSLFGMMTSDVRAADVVPNPLRVYYIGNSVTDTIGYKAMVEMAESRKHTIVWGRHMIPGAPLSWIWSHPADGFAPPPFEKYPKALAEFEWDVLSLQPFDRRLHEKHQDGSPEGDVELCVQFIDLCLTKSPDVQVYIYSRWPQITRQGKGFVIDKDAFDPTTKRVDLTKLGNVDDFSDRWNAKFTGGYGLTNETRDYFERVLTEVRQSKPDIKKKILMVPVGDVMNELHQMMKAGKVPGYTSIYEVFADNIHLNNVGRFIVGTTYYATMFKEDPTGISATAYKVDDADLAKIIQQTVWKVVKDHPYAGIK